MEVLIISVRDQGMVMAVPRITSRSSTLCQTSSEPEHDVQETHRRNEMGSTEETRWAAQREEMHRDMKYLMESGG